MVPQLLVELVLLALVPEERYLMVWDGLGWFWVGWRGFASVSILPVTSYNYLIITLSLL